MSKTLLAVAMSVGLATGAHAQSKFGDVTTSTDPAKAASVEQHAAELKTNQMQPMAHASKHVMRHHSRHVATHHQVKSKPATKS